MATPLIEISGVWREYHSGDEPLMVLKDVTLSIEAGEMVAIMGASGSGKSTLMNILGCLDRPTRGTYRIAGRDVAQLQADEIAQLRRKYFGFIFQHYQLLANLTALGNVEMPALYDNVAPEVRIRRAKALLERFGLADRMEHYPSQLSGGQQQRVSIARALMNGGLVILADEPTGALDSKSGEEVMQTLKKLNAEGHTVIMVTHDPNVAGHARRIIQIKDGMLLSDQRDGAHSGQVFPQKKFNFHKESLPSGAWKQSVVEALRAATKSLLSHPLRTFLSVLGIMIGIAAVVSGVALGKGAQKTLMDNIRNIGTNSYIVSPDEAGQEGKKPQPYTIEDFETLQYQPYVDSATPLINVQSKLKYANVSAAFTTYGVGKDFLRAKDFRILEGAFFNQKAINSNAQEIVIDSYTKQSLFGATSAIGRIVLLDDVPFRIVGIIKNSKVNEHEVYSPIGWMPYTTLQTRLRGNNSIDSILIKAKDFYAPDEIESNIEQVLTARRGKKDFRILNSHKFFEILKKSRVTMNLLISSIAFISLVVGGVGVMNIMLVSVIERTKEIGIRMAVGARRSDIMRQFLIESVLVCLIGGVLGLLVARVGKEIASLFVKDLTMIFSWDSIVVSFVFSLAVGVIFGFFPARNAARLNPVEALARG